MHREQGAVAWNTRGHSAATPLRGQGATEYLVLLAVVLIVALVSISLLGSASGTASETKETQSKIYWQAASPIAITEWGARELCANSIAYTTPYFRIRNTGKYPIMLTKFLAGPNSISNYYNDCNGSVLPINGNFYMAPGEELSIIPSRYTGEGGSYGTGNCRHIYIRTTTSAQSFELAGAQAICQNGAAPGYLTINNFGFEYVLYVEGQQITKKQVGTSPLIVKCKNTFAYSGC